jgi:hypothetical protein
MAAAARQVDIDNLPRIPFHTLPPVIGDRFEICPRLG